MPGNRPSERRPVHIFLAHLAEIPLGDWIAVTMHAPRGAELAAAQSALNAAVRRSPDHTVVFATQTVVFESLHRFESPDGRQLTRLRHSTDNLRAATERAALAVLLRSDLTTAQFGRLYAPFEPIIPSVLLFGLT